MIIYSREKQIANLIERNKCNAAVDIVDAKIVQGKLDTNSENINSLIDKLQAGIVNSLDVFWQPAIMVSTSWNKNDDVFTPEETFNARFTPFLEAVNWNHQGDESNNEVIGVINNVQTVDDEFNVISEIKDRFHIAVGMLVWKNRFPTYVDNIANASEANKMFVSMECYFSDFGYAVKEIKASDNNIILIPRNENTAWLSEKLKAYGGEGTFTLKDKTYRIGRWLKSIKFTGVGYVYSPANPESIIIKSVANEQYSNIDENNITNFHENTEIGVLNNNDEAKGTNMSKENDNKEVKTETSACDMQNEEIQKLKDMVGSLQAEVEASKTSCSTLEASIKEKDAKIVEITNSLTEATNKLDEINRNAVAQERLTKIKAFITIEDESKKLDELKKMSNEAFDIALNYASQAAASIKKVETKQEDTKTLTEAVASATIEDNTEITKAGTTQNENPLASLQESLRELVEYSSKNRKTNKKIGV